MINENPKKTTFKKRRWWPLSRKAAQQKNETASAEVTAEVAAEQAVPQETQGLPAVTEAPQSPPQPNQPRPHYRPNPRYRGNRPQFQNRQNQQKPAPQPPTEQNQQQSQGKNNYAFIDSQNLNLTIRSQKWVLDFRKFRKYLTDNHGVSKAFLFIGYINTNQELYTSLQEAGFLLILKPTLDLPEGQVKGNVDTELVLHTMIEMSHFDKAVIVTGDGDFFCLVDYLKKRDKLEKIIIPDQHHYSSLYKKFLSDLEFMNNLRNKLNYRPH